MTSVPMWVFIPFLPVPWWASPAMSFREPFPDNFQELKRHLELNRVRNCTVIEAGVSSVDGEAAFDPSGDRCTGQLAATGILRVRTLTLDRLIQKEGMHPPSLIKIDIEGSEYECLRRATGVIQKFRPVIVLATHGRKVHDACLELLAKWNYRLKSLDMRSVEMTDELVAYSGDE
jgi:FkbM family methyltransferase